MEAIAQKKVFDCNRITKVTDPVNSFAKYVIHNGTIEITIL